jgi:hypothetical protein
MKSEERSCSCEAVEIRGGRRYLMYLFDCVVEDVIKFCTVNGKGVFIALKILMDAV